MSATPQPQIHSSPTKMLTASTDTHHQLKSVEKPTLNLHVPTSAPAYPAYPGCLARRHSFSVPSSSPRDHIILLPNTSNKRISGRRHSIGLTASNNEPSTPFPATTMYAKIVSHLETNLECRRHFYHLQRFNNCFFGQRMVNCLLAYCITSLNSCMTKDKAIDMCNRLLNHNVIEDVSHRKQPGTTFKSNRLYRFTGKHFWEDTCNTIPELVCIFRNRKNLMQNLTHDHTCTPTHTQPQSCVLQLVSLQWAKATEVHGTRWQSNWF